MVRETRLLARAPGLAQPGLGPAGALTPRVETAGGRQGAIGRRLRLWLGYGFYYVAYRAVLWSARRAERGRDRRLLARVRRAKRIILTRGEIDQIITAVRGVGKVAGDLAEVGVFEGGSACLIAECKEGKRLHLFDTFEGLPWVEVFENGRLFRKGQFKAFTGADELRRQFRRFADTFVYQGIFPAETGPLVADRRFSFVHLDVDVYRSTLECLEFFYPRMSRGGIILSHDYLIAEGVRRAFDEFLRGKPEPLIRCAGSQCMLVKT